MTDHEPDRQITWRIYCGVMALGLVIFVFGVYIGTLIANPMSC